MAAPTKDRDFRSRMQKAAREVETALSVGLGLSPRDLPTAKLSQCCPAGAPYCDTCLINFCFRLGSESAALSDDSLIEAVAEGDKPVGFVPLTAEDPKLMSYLESKGLCVLLSYQSPKWECWLTVFCADPDKTLKRLVDVPNLKTELGVHLDGRMTLRSMVTVKAMEEEPTEDPLVMGLCLGMPIWWSLAWRHILNPSLEPVKVMRPPPPPNFPKKITRAKKGAEPPKTEKKGAAKEPPKASPKPKRRR